MLDVNEMIEFADGPLNEYLFVGGLGKVLCLRRERPDSSHAVWTNSLKGLKLSFPTLLVLEGRLFVGISGHVVELDPRSGDEQWRAAVFPSALPAPVDLKACGDNILVACKHQVALLDKAREGHVLWRQRVKKFGMYSTLFVTERTVFLGCNGSIYALDAATGELVWKNVLPRKWHANFSMHIHDGQLIAGANGHVLALNPATGALVEEISLPKVGHRMATVLPSPTEDGVCFVATSGQVQAMRTGTDEVIWQNDLPGCGYSVSISLGFWRGGAAAGANPVYERGAGAGAAGKINDDDSSDDASPPPYEKDALLTERLYGSDASALVVGMNGYIVALHPLTGRTMWHTSLPNVPFWHFTAFIIDGDRLYAGTNGKLFVLNMHTGDVLHTDGLKGLGYMHVSLATAAAHLDFNVQPIMTHFLVEERGSVQY